MDYIISTVENELIKESKNLFTQENAEHLIENEISFINFIGLLQAGYRAELALGEAKGKEDEIYHYVECLENLKTQITKLGEKMKEFREKNQN